MARTTISAPQLKDGGITKDDLNITTVGGAVITKIVQGTNISISSTGADSGTGVVTINATGGSSIIIGQASLNFGVVTREEYDTNIAVADATITSSSRIVVSLSAETTADHSIDEVVNSEVVVSAGNVVNGVGFTIYGKCAAGTYGLYKVNYLIQY